MAQGLASVLSGTAFLPAQPWHEQAKILEPKAEQHTVKLANKQPALLGIVMLAPRVPRIRGSPDCIPSTCEPGASQFSGGRGRKIRIHQWVHMSFRPAWST